MASPIFDYYQYAQQQATTVSDMLGVARHVVRQRQENRKIQAELAKDMAEKMHERQMASEEFQREMVKVGYQQEMMNQRHDQTIGMRGARLDHDKTRARVEDQRWRHNMLVDESTRENEAFKDVIDAFYNTNREAFGGFGLPKPQIHMRPAYDDNMNFLGYDNVIEGRHYREPDRPIFFRSPQELQDFYQTDMQIHNIAHEYWKNPDKLKSADDMTSTERAMYLSRDDVTHYFNLYKNPLVSQQDRDNAAHMLMSKPFAVKGDEDRRTDRTRERVDQAWDRINHVKTDIATEADILSEHNIRRRYWSPLRFLMDPNLGDVELKGVPLDHAVQTLERGADQQWRGLDQGFFVDRDVPFTKEKMGAMFERFRGLIDEGIFEIALGDYIDRKRYGFYISDIDGSLQFGEMPVDVIQQFREAEQRTTKRSEEVNQTDQGTAETRYLQRYTQQQNYLNRFE